MSKGPPLAAGERVVWAGVHGEPNRIPGGAMGCRVAYAWMMLFVIGTMSIIPLMIFPEARLFALLVVAAIVAAVIAWRSYRKRPAIFVTDQRLVERSLFGDTTLPLREIRGYYRRIDKYRDRYGNVTEVATHHVVLVSHAGGQRSIGPVLEYEALTGLLDGLISRDIDPSKMRGLEGKPPAAAEAREDIFVAVENRTEGDLYGPLVIGPRGLVRFTEKLPIALEGQLLTVLAGPDSPEDLETKTVFLTRRPDAGHALIVDLSSAELGMDSTALRLKLKDRTVHIQLADGDAMRARKFLQARR